MNERSKRFITKILLITMVLNILAPSIIEAATLEIEYKEFITRLELQTGKIWQRPTPIITATLPDGNKIVVDNSDNPKETTGDQWFKRIDEVEEPHISVPVGTKINLDSSASTLGSGTVIDGWDWQIYSQQNVDLTYDKPPLLISEKTTSFTPEEPGIYGVYLNVKDNYTLSSAENPDLGFPNWSDKGNYITKFGPGMGVKLGSFDLLAKDWYFTMMVIDVTEEIDIKTETIVATPQVVTGKDVEIKTVYSIAGVTSEKDKEEFLNREYYVVIRSPIINSGQI